MAFAAPCTAPHLADARRISRGACFTVQGGGAGGSVPSSADVSTMLNAGAIQTLSQVTAGVSCRFPSTGHSRVMRIAQAFDMLGCSTTLAVPAFGHNAAVVVVTAASIRGRRPSSGVLARITWHRRVPRPEECQAAYRRQLRRIPIIITDWLIDR